MKRLALIAAAAALAVPAVFAQTVIVSEPASHVLNHGAVAISPPVDGLPGSSMLVLSTPVAIESSDTTILGGPAASIATTSPVMVGGTAFLDVPAYAVSRPDFQRWMAWEGSRVIR